MVLFCNMHSEQEWGQQNVRADGRHSKETHVWKQKRLQASHTTTHRPAQTDSRGSRTVAETGTKVPLTPDLIPHPQSHPWHHPLSLLLQTHSSFKIQECDRMKGDLSWHLFKTHVVQNLSGPSIDVDCQLTSRLRKQTKILPLKATCQNVTEMGERD